MLLLTVVTLDVRAAVGHVLRQVIVVVFEHDLGMQRDGSRDDSRGAAREAGKTGRRLSWPHLLSELVPKVELLCNGLLRVAVASALLQHALDPLALVLVLEGDPLQGARTLRLARLFHRRVLVHVGQFLDGELAVGVFTLLQEETGAIGGGGGADEWESGRKGQGAEGRRGGRGGGAGGEAERGKKAGDIGPDQRPLTFFRILRYFLLLIFFIRRHLAS